MRVFSAWLLATIEAIFFMNCELVYFFAILDFLNSCLFYILKSTQIDWLTRLICWRFLCEPLCGHARWSYSLNPRSNKETNNYLNWFCLSFNLNCAKKRYIFLKSGLITVLISNCFLLNYDVSIIIHMDNVLMKVINLKLYPVWFEP